MKKTHVVTALALCIAGGASASPISFTEDFSGLAMPAGMESTLLMRDGDGTDRLDFSGANATITNPLGEADKRQYIRTTESDYASVDFVLEATITSTGTGWWEAAYIGLGTGEVGAFNEPTGGPFIGLEHGADDHSRWAIRDGVWRNAASEAGDAWAGTDNWTAGSHRVRLTYTVADQRMYSEVDKDYAGGAFVADLTSLWFANGADDGFDSSNAHIFFGAGNNTSFDDISVTVIPEPATFSLLAAFGGALVFVRRKSRN